MGKNKKLIQEAIVLAIDSLREDICSTTNSEENLERAQAIKTLAEAFRAVTEA